MPNNIELVTKFSANVDELFTTESQKSLVTNLDYSWAGAHTVKVYSVSVAGMNDYGRRGPEDENWSRYGAVEGLDATTQEMPLRKDRSFTFAIDRLDDDETGRALQAATALARQIREVVIPEVDTYTYNEMVENAGQIATPLTLTPENVYDAIIEGTNGMDNAEVPSVNRYLIVTPDTYRIMKRSKDIIMETDITADMRVRGVIAMIDGLHVVKVPAIRLPDDFGFLIAHPVATVAPTKLEDYRVHISPPGISGALVEGRICYDAFVLNNKKNALYYHANA